MNCTMFYAIFVILFVNASLVKSYRTLGGKKVPHFTDFPFQASIRMMGELKHVGAAVVISEKYLLTAAYWFCGTKKFDLNHLFIFVGAVDLENHGFNYKIDSVICEKGGRIALVKLSICIDVQPVTISLSQPPPDAMLTLLGWGASCDGGEGFCGAQNDDDNDDDNDQPPEDNKPILLETASAKLMDIDECNLMYKAIKAKVNPDNEICTDRDPDTNGPCVEDIGGPLLYAGKLIGIYTTYPCRPNYPEVYAKVGYYLDWIQQHTKVSIA